MAMRNLLAHIPGEAGASAADAAFKLAARAGGRVTGLHIRGDVVSNMPDIVESMGERAMVRAFQKMRDKVEGAEKAGAALFEAASSGQAADVTATWSAVDGRGGEVLAEAARVFDLLVTGVAGDVGRESTLEVVENALFATGRPVLAVPQAVSATVGRHVFIAWNKSAEAARAVAAAMPLIQDADKVTIGHVATAMKSGPSAEDLAAGLAAHGITATVRHMEPGHAPVAELLAQAALDAGADLIVMGAYSHSRMRELVLGGVTRHILRNLTLPVLLMH